MGRAGERAVGACYEDFGKTIGARLRKQIEVDNMPFGFTPGKSSRDSVFMREACFPFWILGRLPGCRERLCGAH